MWHREIVEELLDFYLIMQGKHEGHIDMLVSLFIYVL